MTFNGTTILIVDDDPASRSFLRTGLTEEGAAVIEASDRDEVLAAVRRDGAEVVALDLTLDPDKGLALAHALREKANVPILLMLDDNTPFDQLPGLEASADDYIFKPFAMQELVLRIDRILKRFHTEFGPDLTVTFDHSSFDTRRRVVRHLDGVTVPLTEIELKLLDLFVRHPGRVLSRDEISQALHGREWTPFDRTIDTHVARLRRKIEPPEDGPSLIRSVRGVGYVFTGDVTAATALPEG